MFARRLAILAASFAGLSILIFSLTAVAKYKPYGVPDALREEWDAKQEAIKQAELAVQAERSEEAGEKPAKEFPKAFVENAEHDFGLLDPGSQAQHTFIIENRGSAPLAIIAADTSCTCTLSEASREWVPPGETAEVMLTWKTGSERDFYRQYAIIRTNDPRKPEIELAVTGRIRTLLGFQNEQFSDPDIIPGEGASASNIIFSQLMDSFSVDDVRCGLPGFKYEVLPVAPDVLEELKAKSGWQINATTSAALDSGPFSDSIQFVVNGSIDQPDEEKSETSLVTTDLNREIPFAGTVRSSITFYGPGLDAREGLDLGISTNDQTITHRLFVKARGNPPPKNLVVTDLKPDVLRATIEPIESTPNVYRLTLTIPEGAEQTIFNRESFHGYVEVADEDNTGNKNWVPVKGAVIDMQKNSSR